MININSWLTNDNQGTRPLHLGADIRRFAATQQFSAFMRAFTLAQIIARP
jgi:hypothetical protein